MKKIVAISSSTLIIVIISFLTYKLIPEITKNIVSKTFISDFSNSIRSDEIEKFKDLIDLNNENNEQLNSDYLILRFRNSLRNIKTPFELIRTDAINGSNKQMYALAIRGINKLTNKKVPFQLVIQKEQSKYKIIEMDFSDIGWNIFW